MTIRISEKKSIEEFLKNENGNILIVYGRKGMGKSTLLKEICEDCKGFYFSAYPTTEDMELELMYNCLTDKAVDSEISLDKIYGEIDELSGQTEDGSFVTLVIDNYSDFAKAGNDINKEFAAMVQEKVKNLPVKLIICFDSYVSLSRMVLDRMSPWKEENYTLMEIGQLSFEDSYKFLEPETPEKGLFLYGLTGGIPAYLDEVKKKIGVNAGEKPDMDTVVRQCFDENNRLLTHPEEVMHNELRELAYYNRMLTTLASGICRVNEISETVGKPKDIVVPYLKTLMSFNIVKKENPVTEKGNRRKTRYSIVNSSDVFWYRFIAPEYAAYCAGRKLDPDSTMLEAYEKEVFQDVCAQYLIKMSKLKELPFEINEIGNWWENNDEEHTTEGFDLVGLGKCQDEEASVFCNCYYFDKQVEIQELKALIELTKKVKRRGDNFYMIFSKSGFSDHALTVASAIKNIILVDLATIVKDYLTEK